MKSTITFVHGIKTCAVEPSKFCRWAGATNFGSNPVCMLFENEPLFDKDGWVMRCEKCLKEFGENDE